MRAHGDSHKNGRDGRPWFFEGRQCPLEFATRRNTFSENAGGTPRPRGPVTTRIDDVNGHCDGFTTPFPPSELIFAQNSPPPVFHPPSSSTGHVRTSPPRRPDNGRSYNRERLRRSVAGNELHKRATVTPTASCANNQHRHHCRGDVGDLRVVNKRIAFALIRRTFVMNTMGARPRGRVVSAEFNRSILCAVPTYLRQTKKRPPPYSPDNELQKKKNQKENTRNEKNKRYRLGIFFY